jgi:adenine-specific DNA-methyltransferase
VIKYLGSKRLLAPLIGDAAQALQARSAADLFAGTTRIGQELRRRGITVLSSDTAAYSEDFGIAYLEESDRRRLAELLAVLRAAPPRRGYFTRTFCEAARYVHPDNGMRVDGARAAVDQLDLDRSERGLLLTSLIEAADRVDSTVGVQMAYLKRWAPRALQPLELREPAQVAGPPGTAVRRDANQLAGELDGIDVAYLDPPYNQHSYFANYHVWETLHRGDAPDHYGVACKRVDCRTTKSAYNSRRAAGGALADLIARTASTWILLSFSDESFHDLEEVGRLLAERGRVGAVAIGSRRYVGATIGIHNPQGERVGTVSHLRNTEVLFVCGPTRAGVDAVIESGRRHGALPLRTGSGRSRSAHMTAAS